MKLFARIIIFTAVIFLSVIYLPPVVNKIIGADEPQATEIEQDASVEEEKITIPLGGSTEEIMRQFGIPTRQYPSRYGYEWWVYYDEENPSTYFQVGIQDDRVVTSYVIGEDIFIEPFTLGDSYKKIMKKYELSSEIAFEFAGNEYNILLSERELLEHPLLQVDDNEWAILYFDRFSNKLSSVRYLDTETLVKLSPYELTSTGELVEVSPISEEIKNEFELGEAQEIFELTNVIRMREDIDAVEWNEEVADVALLHNQDMSANQFFSDISPTNGDVMTRLTANNIICIDASENIGDDYIDAIALVEEWMNNKYQRENIYNQDVDSVGISVYDNYYTQIFINEG